MDEQLAHAHARCPQRCEDRIAAMHVGYSQQQKRPASLGVGAWFEYLDLANLA
jgi:hypothetical protein